MAIEGKGACNPQANALQRQTNSEMNRTGPKAPPVRHGARQRPRVAFDGASCPETVMPTATTMPASFPQAQAVSRIKGSCTALITPFKAGKVDAAGFQRFVEWQISQGTDGLVPVGTTGETPTLSHEEHKQVIELCIAAAKRRVPVIAGAGRRAHRAGADGAEL